MVKYCGRFCFGFESSLIYLELSQIKILFSTVAWLSVQGTSVSGTVLSATEFRDFLCALYNVSPLNLRIHCDGCGTAFVVMHALSCSIGGLLIAHNNKIRDKLLYISRRVFTPVSVHAESLIHQSRTRSELEMFQGSDQHKDTRG